MLINLVIDFFSVLVKTRPHAVVGTLADKRKNDHGQRLERATHYDDHERLHDDDKD